MIKHYKDPILGSQYSTIEVETIAIVPLENDFSVEKWRDLISHHKIPFQRKILKSNKRDDR